MILEYLWETIQVVIWYNNFQVLTMNALLVFNNKLSKPKTKQNLKVNRNEWRDKTNHLFFLSNFSY